MWAAVAPETRPVSLAGRTAYVLAQDMPGLLAAAPAQPQLLLLGPHDPYLDVHGPSEKALLLPDAARHKAVWQTVSNPGVLLQAGPLRACGAKARRAKALRFALRCLPRFLRPGARRCRRWHSAMPPSAASPLRPARWKSNIQFVFFYTFCIIFLPGRHTGQKNTKKCACILVTLPPCRLAQNGV